MVVKELRLQLKARGVKSQGKKTVLKTRLTLHKDDKAPSTKKRHYCGCLNTDHGLVMWLRNANMKLLVEAGKRKDASWYRKKLKQMFICLTTNTHEGDANPNPKP